MSKSTLTDSDRKEIVLYRIEKSETAYNEAVGNIGLGYVSTAANRLYYSAYYAVSALLIANGVSTKTHSGVKQMFGLYFIKTKLLRHQFGDLFNQLFSLRMTGDYEDRKNLSMEADVEPLAKPTKALIDAVTKLAKDKIQEL